MMVEPTEEQRQLAQQARAYGQQMQALTGVEGEQAKKVNIHSPFIFTIFIVIIIIVTNIIIVTIIIIIIIIIITNNNTQIAVIVLPPSTTHPQLWAELLTFKPTISVIKKLKYRTAPVQYF